MAERTLDLGGLQALMERVRGLKVACVGDLMLDRYVYGEVDRISPEAPIPVLKVKRRVAMPGGVGNVARNVAALGGRGLTRPARNWPVWSAPRPGSRITWSGWAQPRPSSRRATSPAGSS
jgi:hypothetical protein